MCRWKHVFVIVRASKYIALIYPLLWWASEISQWIRTTAEQYAQQHPTEIFEVSSTVNPAHREMSHSASRRTANTFLHNVCITHQQPPLTKAVVSSLSSLSESPSIICVKCEYVAHNSYPISQHNCTVAGKLTTDRRIHTFLWHILRRPLISLPVFPFHIPKRRRNIFKCYFLLLFLFFSLAELMNGN